MGRCDISWQWGPRLRIFKQRERMRLLHISWSSPKCMPIFSKQSVSIGMTKYRKWPTKDRKEHYGLSCRKLAPIELNGALYSSARQDFSHAAGLSWEPVLCDSQSVRRGRPCHLWTWKFHSSSQSSEASALRRWLVQLIPSINHSVWKKVLTAVPCAPKLD